MEEIRKGKKSEKGNTVRKEKERGEMGRIMRKEEGRIRNRGKNASGK